MLARRAPSAITGRALAAAAEVNYGLVHRHFGGKAAVLEAALDELSADFAADVFGGPGVSIPLRLEKHPTFLNAATRVALDHGGGAEFRHRSPVVSSYLDRMQQHRPGLELSETRTSVALGASISLGLAIHGSKLANAVGLVPDDPAIQRLAERWLLGLQEGHGPLGSVPRPDPRHRARSEQSTTDGHTGREAIELRLVVAGAELLSDREPSAISGRSLAGAAGVNYGLIHHYFGTKDEVLRRSMQFHRDRFFAAAGDGLAPAFFSPSEHPGYVRALTRATLDGDLSDDEARYPVMETMVDSLIDADAEGEELSAIRVAIITAVAAQLAWALFTPTLEQGLGVSLAELEPRAAPMLRRLLSDPLAESSTHG